MKLLLLIFFTLISQIAFSEYDSPWTQTLFEEHFKPGECISSVTAGLVIVKAVDENHYETVAYIGRQIVSRGFLETKRAFNKPGKVGGMKVRYLGAKDFPMDNGFNAKFGLWQDCK
jgi:hypothetical protein